MNKQIIDNEIEFAYKAIRDCKICNEEGEIPKNYRGQVSSFGAAILMGSLLQAVAFFSKQGKSSSERPKILNAVFEVMKKNNNAIRQDHLFHYVKAEREKGSAAGMACQEEVLNAAIAVKLAMNLYKMVDNDK